MNIFIPGGAGYIGAWLVPQLLADGHRVTVLDTMWFGDGHLPTDNDNLTIIKDDIRHRTMMRVGMEGQDAIIYFAGISNNDLCIKRPIVAEDVNKWVFRQIVMDAKDMGIKRFIYASSVAAYGSAENARETQPLKPTTPYGEAKAFCEDELWKHGDEDFTVTVTRSASVCGYSPHQRFDLTANRMARDAAMKGRITVNGGEQKRTHVHIQDISDFYKLLLDAPRQKVAGQAFNVVACNQSVLDTAFLVSRVIRKTEIDLKFKTDDRSYTVDGSKAMNIGFAPKRGVEDAVHDLKARFDLGMWTDAMTNPLYENMKDAF